MQNEKLTVRLSAVAAKPDIIAGGIITAMISYLARLTERLLPGMLQIKPARRDELRHYFLSALDPSGGFRGRKGSGDLYYSAFALRGLFLLGILDDAKLLFPTAAFLQEQLRREYLSPADLISWVFCQSLVNVALGDAPLGKGFSPEQISPLLDRWERFRCADGCYAATETSAFSSTYTTFLTAIFYELLGNAHRSLLIPVQPLLSRRREDGGFVELPPLHRSGTNPTAAAVGLLTLLEVPLPEKEKTVECLCRFQLSGGGFQAHAKIPFPDLLSSFSAAVALHDLNAADQINRSALMRFVSGLRSPDGGFFGMPADQQSDVEYTFYGMALEAMLYEALF